MSLCNVLHPNQFYCTTQMYLENTYLWCTNTARLPAQVLQRLSRCAKLSDNYFMCSTYIGNVMYPGALDSLYTQAVSFYMCMSYSQYVPIAYRSTIPLHSCSRLETLNFLHSWCINLRQKYRTLSQQIFHPWIQTVPKKTMEDKSNNSI